MDYVLRFTINIRLILNKSFCLISFCQYYDLAKNLISLTSILELKSLDYLQLVSFIVNGSNASLLSSIINICHMQGMIV